MRASGAAGLNFRLAPTMLAACVSEAQSYPTCRLNNMAWVKLDDHFDEHPKLAGVSNDAMLLWCCALAYCNRNLTDGFVPAAVALRLRGGSPETIQELVAASAWDTSEQGFSVHDYLDFQPTRSSVFAAREAAKERMKAARLSRSRELRENFARSSPNPDPVPVKKNKSKAMSISADEQAVYDHWRGTFKKVNKRYDRISDGRLSKIRARLREFSVTELCTSLDGAARDPWEGRAQHHDLTLLLRNREQVERFLEMPEHPTNGAVKVTGWRMVRGSHGVTHVPDDLGTDQPPRNWA